jgi:hypothetical protein
MTSRWAIRPAPVLLLVLGFLAGCSGQSIQTVGPCTKYETHDFWSQGIAMICNDAQGKPLGMVAGTGTAPVGVLTSGANAAILGATIPLGAALLNPNSTSNVNVKLKTVK